MRKPVFGVSNQVWHKLGCTAAEMARGLQFGFRKMKDCSVYVVKTKVLISCVVTKQLICAFVFAYAKIRFSHDPTDL